MVNRSQMQISELQNVSYLVFPYCIANLTTNGTLFFLHECSAAVQKRWNVYIFMYVSFELNVLFFVFVALDDSKRTRPHPENRSEYRDK